MKIAASQRYIAPAAKLAEKEGGRTRAILKVLGLGATMLTEGASDLAIWIVGALFSLIAFVPSPKKTTERITFCAGARRAGN